MYVQGFFVFIALQQQQKKINPKKERNENKKLSKFYKIIYLD